MYSLEAFWSSPCYCYGSMQCSTACDDFRVCILSHCWRKCVHHANVPLWGYYSSEEQLKAQNSGSKLLLGKSPDSARLRVHVERNRKFIRKCAPSFVVRRNTQIFSIRFHIEFRRSVRYSHTPYASRTAFAVQIRIDNNRMFLFKKYRTKRV